jgi:hypothetical protein
LGGESALDRVTLAIEFQLEAELLATHGPTALLPCSIVATGLTL